jgi:hypothetical protein
MTTPSVLVLPSRASSRDEARALLERLPSPLVGHHLILDGTKLEVASSSFIDELVKGALVDRSVDKLSLNGTSHKIASFAKGSAERRGVSKRLVMNPRS